jgi:predicted metal-dependent hydrolase
MVTGESHYVQGARYRLSLVEAPGKQGVRIRGGNTLELTANPGRTAAQREAVLNRWHRESLRAEIPKIIEKWEPRVGATVADWGIKKMRTRWGSCNAAARRIWLNLDLAKKPPECLEYIVVHEMVHLIERRHNENFKAHMERLMPLWRTHRDTLNAAPLGHEHWAY